MRRIAIIQSNYIPWRGFFDLIARCDVYVIYDSVQYSKNHWHNRNRLKSPKGPSWVTIPIISNFGQPIEAVEISQPWAEKHWNFVDTNYRKAPYFDALAPGIKSLFDACSRERLLTNINEIMLRGISDQLGIATTIVRDSAFHTTGVRTDRLVDLCLKAGATHYLSGPSAKSYLEEEKFAEAGIVVEWMTYPDYPEYPQLWGAFEPALSIVDLLLNAGPNSPGLWRSSAP